MVNSLRHNTAGFTLLELMVTIAIMAIIAGIAVPSYQSLIQANLMRSASQSFYGSLVLARSEAVKNNLPVAICKSDDATSCKGSGTWDIGWIVYIDEDADGVFDSTEQLVDAHQGVTGLTLRATDANLHQVIYQADGTQRVAANFNVCINDDITRGTQITIGLTGRPSTDKGATVCP